jgi:ADP-ribosylation factor-like protein 8
VLTSFTDTGFSHNLYLSLPLLINAFFCTACIACSGKTTLLSVLAHGQAVETVPTIGLNVKVFKKGKVNMKCWDIGGQEQYRSEWSRYTKGCDVVLYVVDAAAPQKLPTAKKELHKLLDDGSIGATPLLVLANKIDLPEHVGESELIEKLQLNYVLETPWMVLPISALQCTNMDQVVEWLTAQGK